MRPWAGILLFASVDVQLRNLLIYNPLLVRAEKSSDLVAIAATCPIVLAAAAILAIRLRMNTSSNRRAERVRQILATRGVSLYEVSRRSAEIFGGSSPSHIPHSLYYDLTVSSLSPSIHQLIALSRITRYRLSDWLAVFGFELDAIPRLQCMAPSKRTVILDSTVYDTEAWIPWFADEPGSESRSAIAPLGQVLIPSAPVRAKELLAPSETKFLYAKIGREDSLAFPDIGPGSVIRIDTNRSSEALSPVRNSSDKRIFVVEHDLGFACSRLSSLANGKITLRSPQLPFAPSEFTLDRELRILGVVDAEIRSLPHHTDAPMSSAASSLPKPQRLSESGSQMNLKQLIRRSRLRSGLSFREASQLTRSIAKRLGDPLYFTAPSTLSDYETLTDPPRHIHKIVTLCGLYSIGFWEFLRASSVSLEETGGEPIPDEWIPRKLPPARRTSNVANGVKSSRNRQNGFLGMLLKRWQDIPLFLRKSLSDLTSDPNFSVSNVFWVGGEHDPIHPWLENAEFVAINRRVRKPDPWGGATFWEQPLYLLLARDGRYLCGCCTLEQGIVIVHPYPDRPLSLRQFTNGAEAEVMGRVTAILRRLT